MGHHKKHKHKQQERPQVDRKFVDQKVEEDRQRLMAACAKARDDNIVQLIEIDEYEMYQCGPEPVTERMFEVIPYYGGSLLTRSDAVMASILLGWPEAAEEAITGLDTFHKEPDSIERAIEMIAEIACDQVPDANVPF